MTECGAIKTAKRQLVIARQTERDQAGLDAATGKRAGADAADGDAECRHGIEHCRIPPLEAQGARVGNHHQHRRRADQVEEGAGEDRQDQVAIALGRTPVSSDLARDVPVQHACWICRGQPPYGERHEPTECGESDVEQARNPKSCAVGIQQLPGEQRAAQNGQHGCHLDHRVARRERRTPDNLDDRTVLAGAEDGTLGPHREQHQEQERVTLYRKADQRTAHHHDLEQVRGADDRRLGNTVSQRARQGSEQHERQGEQRGRQALAAPLDPWMGRDPIDTARGSDAHNQEQHQLLEGVVVERAQELGQRQRAKGAVGEQSKHAGGFLVFPTGEQSSDPRCADHIGVSTVPV